MKVLITSYHYPPLNVVASHRAAGFAYHMREQGWEVQVLTFDWPGEKGNDSGIIRIPVPGNTDKGLGWKIPGISAIKTLQFYRRGEFDWHVRNHASAMESAMDRLLSKEKFDLFIGIFSPHFHFKQCAEQSKKHGIPFFMDFRDLWDNRVMSDTRFSRNEKVRFSYIQEYWRKWSTEMIGFSSVSEPLTQKLAALFQKPGITVLNGWDETEAIQAVATDKFTIGYFGTLLDHQDISPFFQAMAKSFDHRRPVQMVFYGLDDRAQKRVKSLAAQLNITSFLQISEKVLREDALKLMKGCDLLYYPAFDGFRGIYSGKIFEYVGSLTPIAICPTDGDVVENLIVETQTGFCSNDVEKVSHYLIDRFSDWKCRDGLSAKNEKSRIGKFSRGEQVKLLTGYIQELMVKENPQINE